MSKNKKKKILTENDIMKYEIAQELGLMDKVQKYGWGGLTAKEAGKIGGIMTSKKKKKSKGVENETV
ncbi:Small, acid-soluble spore protein, alpha/beta type [Alkalithermobacter thermoalcaliphilus JW-YL-7 = DSM 7308]|uniref:Small acid-soluble spore protein alpha/beta type n=1 Tax=Alkalithermobacter thermoalcaliphilus JW-YL-7 = DSM 7308 TaxID=1121328 RepID=A0A150FRQ2_CLOPD|nr:small acid-soluble spore protein alpha/beta type [[Clostridium] paradoxum JW-YL-7 = DSM 7308]SHK40302.1 Small, acid-soluble spore protein, alpha/beta type [[Clostridium] paradoxum JW-YL-7 = DSM 7308]